MKARVLVYAACMLATGSVNTIATKFQDLTVVGQTADGKPVFFQHPAFQSACMFLGEALCLIPYFLLRARRRAIKARARAARLAKARAESGEDGLGLEEPLITDSNGSSSRGGRKGSTGRLKGLPGEEGDSASSSKRALLFRRTLAFAIPTLCDATATTLLNVGLFYTYASTYQMLRGTLVLFAGGFTILILRRRLYLHHYLGLVLITAGAAIVGAASILYGPHSKSHPHNGDDVPGFALHHNLTSGSSRGQADLLLEGGQHLLARGLLDGPSSAGQGTAGEGPLPAWAVQVLGAVRNTLLGEDAPPGAAAPLFGDAMVILAQAFTALQFILEEKFLGQYRVQPLLAVGIEGAWGVLLCSLALPLCSLVRVPQPGSPEPQPLDDAVAAFRAIAEVPALRNAVLGSIVSIGLFNFFGLSVTQALSGAARATIDACRTLIIWLFSLAAGWEVFHNLQVVGFLVLLAGTSLYNEILRSCLPTPNLGDEEEEEEEEEGGGSQGGYGRSGSGGLRGAGSGSVGEEEWRRQGSGGLNEGEPIVAQEGSTRGGSAFLRATSGRGQASPEPGQQKTHTQAIKGAGRAHAAHYTMARSVRLGFNALSPHDLADEEGEEGDEEMVAEEGTGRGVAVASIDVADPMMLASTPHFGQTGHGLLLLGGDDLRGTSASGSSPARESSEFGGGSGLLGPNAAANAGAGVTATTGGGGFLAFLKARQEQQAAAQAAALGQGQADPSGPLPGVGPAQGQGHAQPGGSPAQGSRSAQVGGLSAQLRPGAGSPTRPPASQG